MRRTLAVLLLAVAGCASTPPMQGPVPDTGTIVGEPTTPRNRARSHTDLATAYYTRSNMSVALEELRAAVIADSTYAPAYGTYGLVYMALQENALAEQNFVRALGLSPDDPDINHNFGWFLCQIGRERESGKYFKRALDNPLYGTPARTYAASGICSMKAGDLRAAETNLERAVRYEPGLSIAQLQLAQVHYRQARYVDARRDLARYSNLAQPTAESLWLGLRIERRLGQRSAELSYGEQLRRRFPGSAEAQSLVQGNYE
ncbi:MAG: type IV pilus biogenesis/stability protein PilW [Burkholderiales bacterium]